MINLEDLAGKHIFSGIEQGMVDGMCSNYVKFTLDGVTYRAVEDPEDGYRSHMKALEIVDGSCKFRLPDVEVVCHHSVGEWLRDDILEFFDVQNGKMILRIGTEDYDDWYPCCVMEYTPENMSCNRGRE